MSKKIDEILDSLEFTTREKAVFKDILRQAKMLQEETMIDELKTYINQKVNDIAYDANPKNTLHKL